MFPFSYLHVSIKTFNRHFSAQQCGWYSFPDMERYISLSWHFHLTYRLYNLLLETQQQVIRTLHFQKLPHLKLLQHCLSSSGFLCLKLVANFSILYYNFLELNEFCCYYRSSVDSFLTKIQIKCLQNLLSHIYSNVPYIY